MITVIILIALSLSDPNMPDQPAWGTLVSHWLDWVPAKHVAGHDRCLE